VEVDDVLADEVICSVSAAGEEFPKLRRSPLARALPRAK